MNIPDFIGSIVTSAVVTGFLSAFLIWLSKSWLSERLKNAIKNEYDEKLETHKSVLAAENGRNLEKLKSDLQVSAISHQIQYSKLHEERAMVIKELYKKLDKLSSDVHSLIRPFQLVGEKLFEEKNEIAFASGNDFELYYRNNKIFFNKSLCTMIDDIVKNLYENHQLFTASYKEGEGLVPSGEHKEARRLRNLAWQKLNDSVVPLKEKIEDQFRKLLGVEDDKNQLPTGLPQQPA